MSAILRLPRVMEVTGLGRSSIYAFIAGGTFPAPISLSTRAVGWTSESIDAWIASRKTKTAQVTSPAVHRDANTSTLPAPESRPIARFGGPGSHLRMGLGVGRSQH
jgi:prophage regulatory protein